MYMMNLFHSLFLLCTFLYGQCKAGCAIGLAAKDAAAAAAAARLPGRNCTADTGCDSATCLGGHCCAPPAPLGCTACTAAIGGCTNCTSDFKLISGKCSVYFSFSKVASGASCAASENARPIRDKITCQAAATDLKFADTAADADDGHITPGHCDLKSGSPASYQPTCAAEKTSTGCAAVALTCDWVPPIDSKYTNPPYCYVADGTLKFNAAGSNTGPCTSEDVCLCSSSNPLISQCTLDWTSSDEVGCNLAAKTKCKQAALGLLTSNMTLDQQTLHTNDCDSTCQGMRGIPHNVLMLYRIAAADMSTEIVVTGVMVAVWVWNARKDKDEGDDENGPLHGIFLFFMFFAFIDFALQISALVYAQIIKDAAKTFFDARCLVTTTRKGLEHQETLTKLVESVGTAAVLGWIELVLMIGEVGNTVYDQVSVEENVSRMLAFIIMTLQVGQVVLATVDFAVFASSAWNDADKLFTDSIGELSHRATSKNWCTALTKKSTLCLEVERRDSSSMQVTMKGRRLPPSATIDAAAATGPPPTLSSWQLPGAAVTGMLVIAVAAVAVVAARWARKRRM